jgi:ferrous iron transport protein B
MLIGFGCTVPAVLATRTIHNRRDRLITILVLPLMSCGARLPIYVLILGAFFPPRTVFRLFGVWDVTNQALLLSGLYAAGVVAGIVSAKLIRATVLRGEAEPFVMELPPYRLPTLKGLLLHTWERTWLYLRKAGTIILGIAILLWALATWPRLDAGAVRRFEQRRATVREQSGLPDAERSDRLAAIERQQRQAALRASAIGHIGRTLAPVLAPCGFDWKISTALVAAAAAKEVFVSQLGVLYSLGEADARSESLRDALTDAYTPLQGLCVMLFCLLCMPCVATVAVVIREASWRWALLQIVYLTALAWLVAAAVYQTGRLLGFGAPA